MDTRDRDNNYLHSMSRVEDELDEPLPSGKIWYPARSGLVRITGPEGGVVDRSGIKYDTASGTLG